MQSVDLDEMDWKILGALQADGRLSFNELARRLHLSSPAIAERVRKLEQARVITGYRAIVDPEATGSPLLAFVQLRCSPGLCLLRTTDKADFPEITEIHKLSGEHCTMIKVRTAGLAHLEGLVDRLGTHGELRTHIVLSTQFARPNVERVDVRRDVTDAVGWAARADDEG